MGKATEPKLPGRKRLALRQAKGRRQRHPKLIWHAFRVTPQKEDVSSRILRALGHVSFMACEKRLRKSTMWDKERKYRIFCSCPGYVFVGFDPAQPVPFYKIFSILEHVHSVIAMDGAPAPLDQAKLLSFLNREESDLPQHYRFMERDREFDKGDSVFIGAGVLEGWQLPVHDIRGGDAVFLVEMLGAETEVPISVDMCEKAA